MTDVLLKTEAICKDFSGVQVSQAHRSGDCARRGAGHHRRERRRQIHADEDPGRHLHADLRADHFEGRPVPIRGPGDAKLGISLIPQEFNLVKDLTVYDNIFLGSEITQRNGLLDKKQMMARTRSLLQELEVKIQARTSASIASAPPKSRWWKSPKRWRWTPSC
jgi:ribose transport system ATP-binding protein